MISQSHTVQSIRHSRTIARSPIFYGWVIWAVATLGIICTAPGQSFTVSLFIDHYIAEFGMGRTTLSTLFGLGTFIAALSLTWVGKLIDRHGNRLIGVIIASVFSFVLISLSLISGPFMLFLSFGAIRFLGQGSMFLVSSTAIAQWWRHRRGWVMGLALVAFALFQTVYLRILQNLIEVHGWRMTWVILGITVGVVMVPIWWLLMRDRPEKYGLLPDVMVQTHQDVTDIPEPVISEVNLSLAEARRMPIFWVFASGRMLAATWGTGLIFHQVSIITGLGHPETAVAQTFGLLALVNAVVTLGAGRIVNRLRPAYVMATQLTLLSVTFILGMTMQHTWMLNIYAVTFGIVFALGATFDGSVWADLFGRLHHGAIRGFVTTIMVIGTSIGPIIYGLSYDWFGSYSPVIVLGLILTFIPITLSLFMKQPQQADTA